MRLERRHWWIIAKGILALAIVAGVGWQLARQLQTPELWEQPLNLDPGWLVLSAVLYLLALGISGAFWFRLMRAAGERPPVRASVRAYYVAHLGKYVPGKAWALLLRVMLISEVGVRPGVAAMTAGYETLTTMAAGALVAIILMTLTAVDANFIWKAGLLLLVAGIPIIPGVFNRIIALLTRLASKAAKARGAKEDSGPLPQLHAGMLLSGLLQTSFAWGVMGVSVLAAIEGTVPTANAPAWTLENWAHCTGMMSLAYIAGFLALPAPGGLGVRELILQQLLEPKLGPWAAVVVIVLRVLWTIAELAMAGTVYLLPVGRESIPDPAGSQS